MIPFVDFCYYIGWGCAISAFSLILWSRLELILHANPKLWFVRTLLAVIPSDDIGWKIIYLSLSIIADHI
jgi:hypothetical protein